MKRGVVVGLVVGAVALVAGGVLVWTLVSSGETAEDGAMRYLEALASGDARAVADALPADDPLTEAAGSAFAGASAYIMDPEVESAAPADADRVAVTVTFTLDGETHTGTILMGERAGRWVPVSDHLGHLTVTTTLGDSVRVGEALLPAADAIALPPAEYPVQAAPAGVLTGDVTAVVVLDDPTDVAIAAALSPDATGLAQTQLDGYAAECTTPAAAIPSSCGIRVPWGADLAALTGLAYRIDTPPAVRLSPDATAFAAEGGVLVVTATGVARDGATTSFTYRDDDWTLRGGVSFTGDEMVLSVW